MNGLIALRDRLTAVVTLSLFIGQPFFFVWLFIATLFSPFWLIAIVAALIYAALSLRLRYGKTTRHGMRWRWFSEQPWWHWVVSHTRWSLEYVGETKLDPSRHYIFALHPHGVFAVERLLFWASRSERWDHVFPGIDTRDLVATSLMLLPGAREWCRWTGCVLADRAIASSVLRDTPHSLLLYPGGEREQLMTTHGKDIIYVRQRRGFIRLALQHNAPILPCYLFGVSHQYKTTTFAMGFRNWLQRRFGIAIPVFWGSLPLFWMPNRSTPVIAVVGTPIEPGNIGASIETPTESQVDELLDRYIVALTSLFNEHKARLGYPTAELEVH